MSQLEDQQLPSPLDTEETDSSVPTEPEISPARKSRKSNKCPADDHSDSDSLSYHPGALKPNFRNRLFTNFDGEYGPKDYKRCGIRPSLGLRYGRLSTRLQQVYEKLAPDFEHEEAALVLLEKAAELGLESVKAEVFKAMMVQGDTASEWKLAVRGCKKGWDTYPHAKDHLLTAMHCPIGYQCPIQNCEVRTCLDQDMKRHLKDQHGIRGLSGSLEEIMKTIKAFQRPISHTPQPNFGAPMTIVNENMVQPPFALMPFNENPPPAFSYAIVNNRQHGLRAASPPSRPVPYCRDVRPVHYGKPPQPVATQRVPDCVSYDLQHHAPPTWYGGGPPSAARHAPVQANPQQPRLLAVAPVNSTVGYYPMQNSPQFAAPNQFSAYDAGHAPGKEHFNVPSEGSLPNPCHSNHMFQPPAVVSQYNGVAVSQPPTSSVVAYQLQAQNHGMYHPFPCSGCTACPNVFHYD